MSFSWETDWVQIGSKWWSTKPFDQDVTGSVNVGGGRYYGSASTSALISIASAHGARLPNGADYSQLSALTSRGLGSTSGWTVQQGTNTYGLDMHPSGYLDASHTLQLAGEMSSLMIWVGAMSLTGLKFTAPTNWLFGYSPADIYFTSVRFVRDTPPVRDMGYIAGVGISGIEHDLEYTEDRNIQWRDVVGAAPRAVPLFIDDVGGDRDYVEASFTVWANSVQAAKLEATLPPYGAGNAFEMLLPGLPDTPAVPGFGAWDPTWQAWRITNCTMIDPMESMGQKGPIIDLYGYRFSIRFPVRGNEHGTISEIEPPCLSRKFMAHQIQDWSRSARPLPVPSPTFTGGKHGRRRDATMSLDHLRADEVEEVIGWYRLNRGKSFGLTNIAAFGPGRSDNANALVRNIKINRGAGWWWDVELDLTLAY